jgi:hypothetical protein
MMTHPLLADIEAGFSPPELSSRLHVTQNLLAQWRSRGIGPEYVKKNGKVWYPATEVERWLESGRRQSTRATPEEDQAARLADWVAWGTALFGDEVMAEVAAAIANDPGGPTAAELMPELAEILRAAARRAESAASDLTPAELDA